MRHCFLTNQKHGFDSQNIRTLAQKRRSQNFWFPINERRSRKLQDMGRESGYNPFK